MMKTNLLFLMFDDLRPELSIYRHESSLISTPNFERLAKRSVTFEHAYAQISVCNPSRNSLLTGLRPDSNGIFGFEGAYKPHLILPTLLLRSGYTTVGIGKTLHWDGKDKETWTRSSIYFGNVSWYEYQDIEWDTRKSSVVPDDKPDSEFPDYLIASQAIEQLNILHAAPQNYMLAVGFKLPHALLHVPAKYYHFYNEKRQTSFDPWATPEKERRFPRSAPPQSYRCCDGEAFNYIKDDGHQTADRAIAFASRDNMTMDGDINYMIPQDMQSELKCGYAAAITFLDTQLGRILDEIDSLQLWDNLTIVLTADHGIHNGEKGMWDKWTLYDESLRVPLLISHPQSPYQGQRYGGPVELIDVFPTLLDIMDVSYNVKRVYSLPGTRFQRRFIPLEGQSMAPVILGRFWRKLKLLNDKKQLRDPKEMERGDEKEGSEMKFQWKELKKSDHQRWAKSSASSSMGDAFLMPELPKQFALSQLLVCTRGKEGQPFSYDPRLNPQLVRVRNWPNCNLTRHYKVPADEWALMGYSLRTLEFRYTAWLRVNRTTLTPLYLLTPPSSSSSIVLSTDALPHSTLLHIRAVVDPSVSPTTTAAAAGDHVLPPPTADTTVPYDEELYDHRGEDSGRELGHRELENIASNGELQSVLLQYRHRLLSLIREEIHFYRNDFSYGVAVGSGPATRRIQREKKKKFTGSGDKQSKTLSRSSGSNPDMTSSSDKSKSMMKRRKKTSFAASSIASGGPMSRVERNEGIRAG